MNSFYVNLQAELADAKEELWAQTRIDGAEAGKKILLKGEPKDTDSVFVDEKGERIFQERRLILRKMKGHLSKEEAIDFYNASDKKNVETVINRSKKADIVLNIAKNRVY